MLKQLSLPPKKTPHKTTIQNHIQGQKLIFNLGNSSREKNLTMFSGCSVSWDLHWQMAICPVARRLVQMSFPTTSFTTRCHRCARNTSKEEVDPQAEHVKVNILLHKMAKKALVTRQVRVKTRISLRQANPKSIVQKRVRQSPKKTRST